MPSPSTSDRTLGSAALSSVTSDLRTQLAALLVFLGTALTSLYVIRTGLWSTLQRDLGTVAQSYVAVTPYDVIVLEFAVAIAVGFVFAIETVLYTAFRRREPRITADDPGGRMRRAALIFLGVAAFPVGAVAGYEVLVPVVATALFEGAVAVSIVRAAGVAYVIAIVSGLLVQLGFAAAVRRTGAATRDSAGR